MSNNSPGIKNTTYTSCFRMKYLNRMIWINEMPTWVIKLTSIINFSTFNTVFTITFNKIFYGLEQTLLNYSLN